MNRACVHIYCVKELYEEAMDLALKVGRGGEGRGEGKGVHVCVCVTGAFQHAPRLSRIATFLPFISIHLPTPAMFHLPCFM